MKDKKNSLNLLRSSVMEILSERFLLFLLFLEKEFDISKETYREMGNRAE